MIFEKSFIFGFNYSNGMKALTYIIVLTISPPKEKSHYAMSPITLPFPVGDLGQGAVISQAGLLNLKEVNIMCDVHVHDDGM